MYLPWRKRGFIVFFAFLIFFSKSLKAEAEQTSRVALDLDWQVPKQENLLQELGIQWNDVSQSAVKALSRWIGEDLPLAEKLEIIRECKKLTGQNEPLLATAKKLLENFKLTENSLACLPWLLELRAAEIRGQREQKLAKDGFLIVARTYEQFLGLKNLKFNAAFLRLNPAGMQELVQLSKFLLKENENCEYAGTAAALIARAEAFFPAPEAHAQIEELYPEVWRCLRSSDDGYERTHLRVGLIRLLRGESRSAQGSLLMALRAENRAEEFRVLFWLGLLQRNLTENFTNGAEPSSVDTLATIKTTAFPPAATNPFWTKLRSIYPISIHAIVAGHLEGADPMGLFSKETKLFMMRRGESADREFDLIRAIFELLMARSEQGALKKWSSFVGHQFAPTQPEKILYLAWCHNRAANYRASIAMLTLYLAKREHPGRAEGNMPPPPLAEQFLDLLFPRVYASEILDNADTIDPVLLFALIRQESAFDPRARSVANARGLMQLLPSTAAAWLKEPLKELYDPVMNLRSGVQFMQILLRKFGGNVAHTLAAYNAGPGHLERWRRRYPTTNDLLFADLIPFRETRGYVAVIQRNAYWYGRLLVQKNDALAAKVVQQSREAQWKSETVYRLLEESRAERQSSDQGDSLGALQENIFEGLPDGLGVAN